MPLPRRDGGDNGGGGSVEHRKPSADASAATPAPAASEELAKRPRVSVPRGPQQQRCASDTTLALRAEIALQLETLDDEQLRRLLGHIKFYQRENERCCSASSSTSSPSPVRGVCGENARRDTRAPMPATIDRYELLAVKASLRRTPQAAAAAACTDRLRYRRQPSPSQPQNETTRCEQQCRRMRAPVPQNAAFAAYIMKHGGAAQSNRDSAVIAASGGADYSGSGTGNDDRYRRGGDDGGGNGANRHATNATVHRSSSACSRLSSPATTANAIPAPTAVSSSSAASSATTVAAAATMPKSAPASYTSVPRAAQRHDKRANDNRHSGTRAHRPSPAHASPSAPDQRARDAAHHTRRTLPIAVEHDPHTTTTAAATATATLDDKENERVSPSRLQKLKSLRAKVRAARHAATEQPERPGAQRGQAARASPAAMDESLDATRYELIDESSLLYASAHNCSETMADAKEDEEEEQRRRQLADAGAHA